MAGLMGSSSSSTHCSSAMPGEFMPGESTLGVASILKTGVSLSVHDFIVMGPPVSQPNTHTHAHTQTHTMPPIVGINAISTQIPVYSHPNILSYSHVFPQYMHILPYSELIEYAVFCRFGIIVYLDVF